MKCGACSHDMVTKLGEIDLRIGGKLYLARNVYYDECLSCGEKVLSPELSEILFKKIEHREFAEQMINVPVLDGSLMGYRFSVPGHSCDNR